MSTRPADPRKLDLPRLAATGAERTGTLGTVDLPRLVADAPLLDDGSVAWSALASLRRPSGSAPQTWLHLQARATVTQVCQRCLQPMAVALAVDRQLRFVADEALAEQLDEDSEDDVLALPPRGLVDMAALVEDELILSLPLVPRHETCPQPLAVPAAPEPPARRPFEALAALKRRPGQAGEGGDGGDQGTGG